MTRASIALTATIAFVACGRAPAGSTSAPVTLVVSLNGDPGALNPAVTTSGNTHPVTDQIFNGLVGLDENLSPVPELAERWTIEDDGRVYRFALRKIRERVDIGDRQILDALLGGTARIARRDIHGLHPWTLRQTPRHGMFAPAAADDQKFHGRFKAIMMVSKHS